MDSTQTPDELHARLLAHRRRIAELERETARLHALRKSRSVPTIGRTTSPDSRTGRALPIPRLRAPRLIGSAGALISPLTGGSSGTPRPGTRTETNPCPGSCSPPIRSPSSARVGGSFRSLARYHADAAGMSARPHRVCAASSTSTRSLLPQRCRPAGAPAPRSSTALSQVRR